MSEPSPAFEAALRDARQHTSTRVRRTLRQLEDLASERPLSEAEQDRARAYREVLRQREDG